MWLLVGLGNPGDEHARQRHNIGFMAVDEIASAHGFSPFKKKFKGELAEGSIGAYKFVLLKPQTYMNLSGESIGATAKFYKITPDRIFIFHDELDLEAGKIRLKLGGGNAGHNGLRSADAHLGTPDYWRVRIGIGHPGDKERVHGHVLGNFAKSDAAWVSDLLRAMAKNAGLLALDDKNKFTTKVALDLPASEPKGKKEA